MTRYLKILLLIQGIERNRRRFTIVSDRRTFVTRIVVSSRHRNPPWKLGESGYRARLTVLFATLERNQNARDGGGEWACPRLTFDYIIVLSIPRSFLHDEISANVGDIRRGGFSAILYINLKSIPKYLTAKVSIIFLQKFVNKQY